MVTRQIRDHRDKALWGVSLRRCRGHVLYAPCRPSPLPPGECKLLYQACPRLGPLGYLPGPSWLPAQEDLQKAPLCFHPPPQIPQNKFALG